MKVEDDDLPAGIDEEEKEDVEMKEEDDLPAGHDEEEKKDVEMKEEDGEETVDRPMAPDVSTYPLPLLTASYSTPPM